MRVLIEGNRSALGSGGAGRGRASNTRHPLLQLQRLAGNHAVQRVLHPQSMGNALDLGAGRPLANTTRALFERGLGRDLDRVRVHDNAGAAASARALNARAYTLGRDIVFAAGEHRPDTATGRYLLAHELTHVVQQGAVDAVQRGAIPVDAPDSGAEREAHSAATALSQGVRVRTPNTGLSPRVQRVPLGTEDPIHGPIVEDYRRRHGLPLTGVDEFGSPVGPSAGEIKYSLSLPNQIAHFAAMTPWQLAQQPQSAIVPREPNPPAWALARFADYARAARLAQAVFSRHRIRFDVDGPSQILGRTPRRAERRVLDTQLARILALPGVRAQVGGTQGRGVPGGESPTMRGRVRIARNQTEFGIKRYQLEMSVLGLRGQNQTELDTGVEQLWQMHNITPGDPALITDQERRLAVLVSTLFAQGNPGFYHPGDDVIYLQPHPRLRTAEGADVARHETVHLLGGRERTREVFVARYGVPDYVRYWSTFEEGMAEMLARESRPAGQAAPSSTTTRSTTTEGGSTTTVEVTVGPGYDTEVGIMRAIMGNAEVGREGLLSAYFTGVVPEIIFDLLERELGRP